MIDQPARHDDDLLPSENGVRKHLCAVYRWRWIALTTFVVVLMYTALRTFTAMPVYEATTQLLIRTDERNVLTFEDVVKQDRAGYNYAETQYRLLRSRALARRTISALGMWHQPPIGSPAATVSPRPSSGVGDAVHSTIRSDIQTRRPETHDFDTAAADENEDESAAIDRLLAGLTIAPIRNSHLVDVKYRSPDPRLAARVVSELVRQYIAQADDERAKLSQDASGWLTKQLATQRQQLEKSELALQRYRERNDAITLENPQNIVVQKLADLNAAVTKAKMERIEKESQYTQLLNIRTAGGDLDSFPAILANSYIQQLKSDLSERQAEHQQLRQRFGEKHPAMVKLAAAVESATAKLEAEVDKVVQAVRNEFLAAQSQEQSITEALNSQKTTALAQNRKEIEYGVLQREVATNRQIYEGLLQRAKEAGISGELQVAHARIVDEAEIPRAPVLPRHGRDLMFGLAIAIVLALGVALLLEHLDNRIKTPDEIAAQLNLPVLGLVPRLAKGQVTGAPLINNGVPAKFAEAFKAVRTNVQFSSAHAGSRTLVIASTGPGEGKTLVSTNLAIALAQMDQRVILIDADMRRPTAHQLLGEPQEPGLSNVLVGDAEASSAVRRSTIPGLWLLPAGRIPPHPAELLASSRFTVFLSTLSEKFDWVILDSPPVMAVTDASVMAHSASGVIFVVGSEMVERGAARTAIRQLLAAEGKLVGAVLNRVNLDGDRYYYADYYRREYDTYQTVVR
jgi:capsular exopolysaccharide synthesis family protein